MGRRLICAQNTSWAQMRHKPNEKSQLPLSMPKFKRLPREGFVKKRFFRPCTILVELPRSAISEDCVRQFADVQWKKQTLSLFFQAETDFHGHTTLISPNTTFVTRLTDFVHQKSGFMTDFIVFSGRNWFSRRHHVDKTKHHYRDQTNRFRPPKIGLDDWDGEASFFALKTLPGRKRYTNLTRNRSFLYQCPNSNACPMKDSLKKRFFRPCTILTEFPRFAISEDCVR